jgi:hypothetical protein
MRYLTCVDARSWAREVRREARESVNEVGEWPEFSRAQVW